MSSIFILEGNKGRYQTKAFNVHQQRPEKTKPRADKAGGGIRTLKDKDQDKSQHKGQHQMTLIEQEWSVTGRNSAIITRLQWNDKSCTCSDSHTRTSSKF